MMNDFLNLTNLKYFSDAVKFGGVSASAKVNFVTQSAISQGIAKLEKILGISLVAHHPKCFRVTPEGEFLFTKAQTLLKNATELPENLLRESEGNIGNLDFACTHSFALAVVPPYLKRFRTEHPSVKIKFHNCKNDQIKRMLIEGTIDFGILPDEDDLDSFEKLDIYKGHLKPYASRDLSPEEQKKLGFILALPGSKERILFVDSYTKRYGEQPTGILEVTSWEVITQLVSQGMGIGYLPDYMFTREGYHLKEVELELESHPYKMSAISPAGMKLRKSSEIFLSYFKF